MSEYQKNKTLEPVKNDNSELVVMSNEELLSRIEKAQQADVEKAAIVGIDYWVVEDGKEMRGVFRGFKEHVLTKGDRAGEIIQCPVIQVSKYQAFISMAVVLVDTFKNITPNSMVYVKCESAKKGEAAKFTVKVIED